MICTVDDCGRKHYAHWFCKKHYTRMRSNGSLEPLRREDGSGCIANGYRLIYVNGKRMPEHVHIVENILGHKLPKGAVVHHVDGNRSNNDPSNLVVCENRAYHKLLHVRQKAYEATGDPTKRKCQHCREWDSLENLAISLGHVYHPACKQIYNRSRKYEVD